MYLFAGEQRDAAIGLDYLRARYLDVGAGRFVARDPFEPLPQIPVSLNRYAYAFNRPITLLDARGLWPTDIHNDLLEEAFGNFGGSSLSKAIIGILKGQSLRQDSIGDHEGILGGQSPSSSFEHAMRSLYQSKAEAKQLYNGSL